MRGGNFLDFHFVFLRHLHLPIPNLDPYPTRSMSHFLPDKLDKQEGQGQTFLEYAEWEWPDMVENEVLQWPASWYRPRMRKKMNMLMGKGKVDGETECDFPIVFQNVNVSYKMLDVCEEVVVDDLPGGLSGKENVLVRQEPEIRLCGTNQNGNSVCVRVRGFRPYFRVGMFCDKSTLWQQRNTYIQVMKNIAAEHSKDVEMHAHIRMEQFLRLEPDEQERWRIARMHAQLHYQVLEFLKTRLRLNHSLSIFSSIPSLSIIAWESMARRWAEIVDELQDRFIALNIDLHMVRVESQIQCPHLAALRQQYASPGQWTKVNPVSEILRVDDRGVYFTFIEDNAPVEKKKKKSANGKKKSTPPSTRSSKQVDQEVEEYEEDEYYIEGEEECEEKDPYSHSVHPFCPIQKVDPEIKPCEYCKPSSSKAYDNKYFKVDVHCNMCKETLSYLECIRMTMMRIQCTFQKKDPYEWMSMPHKSRLGEMLCGCSDPNRESSVSNEIKLFQDLMETFLSNTVDNVLAPLETFVQSCKRKIEFHTNGIRPYYEMAKGETRYVSKVTMEKEEHAHFIDYIGENRHLHTLRVELFRPPDCSTLRTAIQYAGLLVGIVPAPLENTIDTLACQPLAFDFIQTYESDVPFVLRFCNDRVIKGMGWVTVDPLCWEPIPIHHPERVSKCQVEVLVRDPECIRGDNERKEMAKLRCLGFDCEMASANTDYFVCATNMGDILTQISCVVYEQGNFDEPVELCIFSLGGCDPLLRRANRSEVITDLEKKWYGRVRIYSFSSERELLLAFRRFFEINCFDMVFGYNSVAFDMVWLMRRANNTAALGTGMPQIFGKMGKFIERRVESKYGKPDSGQEVWTGMISIGQESFRSNQSGTREYECVRIPGVDQFDIMLAVMATRKLRAYNLNAVGRQLAKMEKIELDHVGITKHATSALDVHRSVVSRYCMWDTLLTMIVGVKKDTYDITYAEMARCTGVPLKELLTKGQTVKVYSQLIGYLKDLREGLVDSEFSKGALSFIIPYMRKCPLDVNPSIFDNSWMVEGVNDDMEGLYGLLLRSDYKGGYVFTPKRGFYTDIIFCVDFRSLYPNIIRSFNLCYTTHIPSVEEAQKMGLKKAWDFRPVIEGGDGPMPHDASDAGGDFWVFDGGHCFVRRHILEGVLPRLLQRVLDKRQEMKNELKKHDYGTAAWKCYNAAQLAFKITANSVYGFTGAKKLAARYIASTVTSIGRYLILQSNDMCIEYGKQHHEFKNDNIYGDSVTGDTPILVKNSDTGIVSWIRIDSIEENHSYIEREGSSKDQVIYHVPRYLVWSEHGWTPLVRCIRHRSGKDIYRVVTHTGVVDVTEDHSLLDIHGNEISPRDVRVGTCLLHHSTRDALSDEEVVKPPFSVKEAYAMGAFFADGSCGEYDYDRGRKFSWGINKQDRSFLESCAEALPFDTKILDTTNSLHVYKLVAHANGENGAIRDIVTRYRSLFYNAQGQKRVPTEIMMAPLEYVEAFFDGFYAGDGSKKEPYTRFCQRGKETCAGLIFIAQRLGWMASVNTRKDKPDIFRVTLTRGKQRIPVTKVKKIYLLRGSHSEEYVYDLETENHHFHVGPGNMVVHNTDSTMNRFLNLKKDTYSEKTKKEMEESTEERDWLYDAYSFDVLLKAARMGETIGEFITENFQRQGFFAIEMEFEKIYYGAAFLMPKKYGVYKYEFDGKSGKLTPHLSSSGLETVRRDTTKFLQDTLERVLKITLEEKDLGRAISFAQREMMRLKDGEVDMRKLVITGNFSKRADQYVNPVPHIEAVKRAEQIDAMLAPRVGQRISYVVVKREGEAGMGNKLNVYEKTELFRIAMMRKMEPDTDHYLEKCVDALSRFFAACVAPNMPQEEGQSYVAKTMFYDVFAPADRKRKLEQAPLLRCFAKQMKREGETEKQAMDNMVTKVMGRGKAGEDSSEGASIPGSSGKRKYKTEHSSFKDFLKASGMDSKGRRMKRKKRSTRSPTAGRKKGGS